MNFKIGTCDLQLYIFVNYYQFKTMLMSCLIPIAVRRDKPYDLFLNLLVCDPTDKLHRKNQVVSTYFLPGLLWMQLTGRHACVGTPLVPR